MTVKKKKKKAKKFIQGAIKRPGSLTSAAKAAGQTISQYCARSDLTTLRKRQCVFYNKVLKPASKNR